MDQLSRVASPILLSVFSNTGPYKKETNMGAANYDDLENCLNMTSNEIYYKNLDNEIQKQSQFCL